MQLKILSPSPLPESAPITRNSKSQNVPSSNNRNKQKAADDTFGTCFHYSEERFSHMSKLLLETFQQDWI